MSVYSSWVHGSSVLLERREAGSAWSESDVKNAFRGDPGDIVDMGNYVSFACLRIGWASRFIVFDSGSGNLPKSGHLWCHYAIPTPVIVANKRAEADTVLVNYHSNDFSALRIEAVHVWDGNKRIFAEGAATTGSFNGGIPAHSFDANLNPNVSQLLKGDIQKRPIYFGVGVSLLIRAQEAKDTFLEIRSVGIDFHVPD